MSKLFVLPSPNLDMWSKIKWFLYITCWGYLITPYSRKAVAHAIVAAWVLSLTPEQVNKLLKKQNTNI